MTSKAKPRQTQPLFHLFAKGAGGVLVATLVMAALPVWAGSFCVAAVGITPQCYYDDIASCQSSAGSVGGSCVINPEASPVLFGSSRYCTVQSDMTGQCIYADRGQCSSEASHNDGICIERADLRGSDLAPDPFKYDDRIQN